MNGSQRASGPGRIEFRADEPNLTPYAGLAVSGELLRRLDLVGLIDHELGLVKRAAAVKQRGRGVSAGALVVSLAEAQLVGAECFDDIEDLRADTAGAPLRAVAATPSAPTARQLARRYRRSHLQAVERGLAQAGNRLDRELGRDVSEPVTIDLDATEVEVHGRKQGAKRSNTGALAFYPYIATWAEQGRALVSELEPGNRARISAAESLRLLRRAKRLLPEGHGEVSVRADVGFYAVELMSGLRREGMRFSFSVARTATMWAALATVPDTAWQPAEGMAGAEIAETSFSPQGWGHEPLRLLIRRSCFSAAALRAKSGKSRRLRTIPADQLQLALDGGLDSVYGYSFIVTDKHGTSQKLERFHRDRAQIEERLKDAKLGQALRHLPSHNLDANRVWLQAALTALNINAMLCDLSPALRTTARPGPTRPSPSETEPQQQLVGADETALPRRARRRRAAKTLRWLLYCVPARIARSGRQTVLHLQTGLRHQAAISEAYDAAYTLAPP